MPGTTSHLPTKLEGGVLVLEVVLLMRPSPRPSGPAARRAFPTSSDVVHLRAVGQQFMWNFQYANTKGEFGKRDALLVSTSNQLGVDWADPANADCLVTSAEVHVPVNTPCIIDVMSKDVIHDFCIPNMRTMEDAILGADHSADLHPRSRPATTTSSAPSFAAAATPSCAPSSSSTARPTTRSGTTAR